MLLNLKYNFLFVHIAKTGGTSVRAALSRLNWADPWYGPRFIASRLSHLSGHRLACKLPRHARVIAAYEMLPRELFERLYKFAFVRNPWDLQVSSYFHLKRERPQLVVGCADFIEFIRFKLDKDRPYQYHLDTSIELQSDYFIGLHGELLVDRIGRYENLEDDFAAVCTHLKLPPLSLGHRRQARERNRDYRSYYDDATAALVAEYFHPDIEAFAYSFDQKHG